MRTPVNAHHKVSEGGLTLKRVSTLWIEAHRDPRMLAMDPLQPPQIMENSDFDRPVASYNDAELHRWQCRKRCEDRCTLVFAPTREVKELVASRHSQMQDTLNAPDRA